jgi:uncharacterized membrane protein
MAFLAVYVPLSGQRRLIFGAVIPLSALAAIGLCTVVIPKVQNSRMAAWLSKHGYSRERLGRVLVALTIAMASISNLFLLASATLSATLGHPDLAQPAAVEEAITWLGEHSAPEAVILSSYRVGNIIPARIGRRVVWGHWDETAFYEEKKADVIAFFNAGTSDAERRAILRRYGVDYVFYGPAEQAMSRFDLSTAGPAPSPRWTEGRCGAGPVPRDPWGTSGAGYLKDVYRNRQVVVYHVQFN